MPWSVVVGDFNVDGKPDLAVATDTHNTAAVLLNSGNGTFSASVDYAAGGGARFAAVGDFNGDGASDLAVSNYTGNTVSVLINQCR